VEQILIQRKRSSNLRLSNPNSSSLNGDLFKTENALFADLPFEVTKEQLEQYYFENYEESTHDSNQTNPSKS